MVDLEFGALLLDAAVVTIVVRLVHDLSSGYFLFQLEFWGVGGWVVW